MPLQRENKQNSAWIYWQDRRQVQLNPLAKRPSAPLNQIVQEKTLQNLFVQPIL
jgi:hypothetical protein